MLKQAVPSRACVVTLLRRMRFLRVIRARASSAHLRNITGSKARPARTYLARGSVLRRPFEVGIIAHRAMASCKTLWFDADFLHASHHGDHGGIGIRHRR